jgi:integrase
MGWKAPVGVLYGVRRSEVLALHWDDLDVEAKTLRIEESVVAVAKGAAWNDAKNARSRRRIPLDDDAMRTLQRRRVTRRSIHACCEIGHRCASAMPLKDSTVPYCERTPDGGDGGMGMSAVMTLRRYDPGGPSDGAHTGSWLANGRATSKRRALPSRYSETMATTMQVSEASRDRLRSLGRPGATLEETLVDALDALEREQFWAAADAADARRRAMTPEQQAAVAAAEADAQRWLDAL